jgi:hypothetical protein
MKRKSVPQRSGRSRAKKEQRRPVKQAAGRKKAGKKQKVERKNELASPTPAAAAQPVVTTVYYDSHPVPRARAVIWPDTYFFMRGQGARK